MVAERHQITSLRRPPEGWDAGAEERIRRARASHAFSTRTWLTQQATDTPSPIPAADLPTLTLGVSTLPESCPNCTSRFLNVEPPLGEHQRGMVTCGRCSRQVCWLGASEAPPGGAFKRVIPATEPSRVEPTSPPLGAMKLCRFERRAGCGPACDDQDGHDPETHESYGRDRLIAEQQARATGVARFGPLFIDFDRGDVEVVGEPVLLTATEWRLLRYLATRVDRLCGYFQIAEAVWDHRDAVLSAMPSSPCGRFNKVRSLLGRLRAKLGPAAALIETTRGVGLTLGSRLEPDGAS